MNVGYIAEMHIRYGKLEEMIAWCEKNCAGEWGYTIVDEAGEQPGSYNFKFESEKDFVTFLVWKK